jgi:putative endonuclease
MGDGAGGRSPPAHLAMGRQAEDLALTYLAGQGMRVMERNYRCRMGEIDLIMEDGGCCVFVEVRYRASDRFGSALESIDARKRARIAAAAGHYLTTKGHDRPSRFDVIAVAPGQGGLGVQWIKDAFQLSGT